MMTVEEKPDVTYSDIGGCKEQLEKLREVVEMPLLQPERFVQLGIDPPKGVLLYGPPGTGKTLTARAVANRTDACFICVIGSELVQKYVGEGARMVRELFTLARSKKACILFIDEVDAIGGSRGSGGSGSEDDEVQRTMLEIVNQLDGFDARGNVKVLMATNRPDTLDPALLRPGRLDRKIEFSLPDLDGRTHIFKIQARSMNMDRDIRFELLARLCPNCTGADIRSVCTEAGMFAIRARRKSISEKDLIEAINKVVKGYAKFSATPNLAPGLASDGSLLAETLEMPDYGKFTRRGETGRLIETKAKNLPKIFMPYIIRLGVHLGPARIKKPLTEEELLGIVTAPREPSTGFGILADEVIDVIIDSTGRYSSEGSALGKVPDQHVLVTLRGPPSKATVKVGEVIALPDDAATVNVLYIEDTVKDQDESRRG
ncbi:26S protease regulatory subunit 7, partial [Perkinsus olseni]